VLILTIRSDNPQAEIGLYDDQRQLAYQSWAAHRELGRTIHTKIGELLQEAAKDWADIQGIVGFQGPGSFTGLRIGLTVANTLAYGRHCPVVGAMGEQWQSAGIDRLLQGDNDHTVMPEYGAEANITVQRK
jgi:tRNA threonylcarbamoyladenosine biosynthesis protein TsaB